METEISTKTIESAVAGNIESFEKIYRCYSSFVYNVAARVSANIEDAKEITHDVFVTVFDKLGTFGHKSSLKTWLYRITVNTALNYRKRTGFERLKFTVLDDNIQPQEDVRLHDNGDEANRLLAKLPENQRVCLALRAIEGLSYEEISDVLGVNINTVRTRIRRGREFLIGLIKEKDSIYELQTD